MEKKSKFDTLFESIINNSIPPVIEEKVFSKKTNPAKPKYPNRPKRKKSDVKSKIARAKKEKPLEHSRRDMKLSRGGQRKRQNFVPLYRQLAGKHDLMLAKNKLAAAKKADSGIWKLSKPQVIELATKYEFNIPSATKRTKHLGSTGIVMWRRDKDSYYLVKFGKHFKEHR